jgi:catechol 2,3-dioxygenase-like lactoylglutathione lyase family enzyme
MYLNHLDLQVPDVPATAAFFERHFGFTIQGNRTSPAIIILAGEGGFTLVLQRRRDGESYPEGFHCGFIVEDEARVRRQHALLTGAGVECSDLIVNGRGTIFYLRAPGDFTIEVSCRPRAS